MLGMALAATPAAGRLRWPLPEGRLFFDTFEIDRIRANAQTPLLKAEFESWKSLPAAEAKAEITKALETGELLYDWGRGLEAIYRQATLALLTDDRKHKDLTLVGLETLRALPNWDYLRDGGEDVLGLMRASKATTATLLSLEVMGDDVDPSLRAGLMEDVAEKGCVPCALTIHQMNNPDDAKGWGVDEVQRPTTTWDMSRWPWILAVNNLRAIPTMGLGLGALALQGRDDRAATWHSAAVDSSRRFLNLFEDDGSYFEGISYVDFAFRTLFLFFEADYRVNGDIDWVREANFEGVINYIVALQTGRKDDGWPDVVNISDSRHSVFTTIPSWIANRSGNQLAAYAAREFSRPAYFSDFLWYRPQREGKPPPDTLKNVKMDLGWIVARTGWGDDDTVLSFRSGGPMNHEHADRNSFLLKSGGERLLTEHFGAAYRATDPHWLLRLPIAHNSVLIDGQGHQYHNGEEGTNESLAAAEITQYHDGEDIVYWSSDATQAYALVDDRVTLVRRSVIFRKPEVVILIDEFRSTQPVSPEILFHPDNRDNEAKLEIFTGGEFGISRPKARLGGRCFSANPVQIVEKRLDLPEEYGAFPYLSAVGEASEATAILTSLAIGEKAGPEIKTLESGWRVRLDGKDFAQIRLTDGNPEILIS